MAPAHPAGSRSRSTTLDEVAEAVAAGADIILLDNMDVATMRSAVELVAGRALLEASGDVRWKRSAQSPKPGST